MPSFKKAQVDSMLILGVGLPKWFILTCREDGAQMEAGGNGRERRKGGGGDVETRA